MTPVPLLTGPSTDQRLVYSGITWQQFKLIQAGFADSPGMVLSLQESDVESPPLSRVG